VSEWSFSLACKTESKLVNKFAFGRTKVVDMQLLLSSA